jgi:hypothetical protein
LLQLFCAVPESSARTFTGITHGQGGCGDNGEDFTVVIGGVTYKVTGLWTLTPVSGTYFTDGQTRGMHVGDFVIATDRTTPRVNFHRVTALAPIDPANPTAIRSATLSAGVKIGN